MKVLAIRGENLASLERQFSVDFTADPLGRAGLFAITGPTGAGKSTLLDVICLCLYDTTPRLAQSGGSWILVDGMEQESALRSSDQRNILRRGAGSCWAELDFTGRKGRTLTARWSVHRARNSPTGKVQSAVWSLRLLGAELNDTIAAGTKTEVAEAIRREVGLDFEQFRRSVLLAQGDFAAFLKANQDQRAVLLEQMTGSEIYARVSREARIRHNQLEQEQKNLHTQLGEHKPLSEADRSATEEAFARASEARTASTTREKAAEAAVLWHGEQEKLDAGLQKAETERQEAAVAVEAAAPRRAQLERMEALWPLRALADEARRSEQAANTAQSDLHNATRAHQAAATAAAQAQTEVSRATGQVAACRVALRDQLQSRLEEARAGKEACVEWLSEHAALVRICAADSRERLTGAPGRPGSFDRRVTLARDHHELVITERPALEAKLADARRLEQELLAERTRTEALVQTTAAAVHTAEAEQKQIEASLPEALGRTLQQQRQAHTQLQSLSERAAEQLEAHATALALVTEKRAQLEAAQAQATQAEATQRTLATRIEQAEADLTRARAAVSATELRQRLRPGEPCDVCGSETHPWADGSPLAAVFDTLEATVRTLRAEHTEATNALATAQSNASSHREAGARGQKQVETAAERLQHLHAEWLSAAAPVPDAAAMQAAAPNLHNDPTTDRTALLSQLHQSLTEQEQQWAANQARLHTAREALTAARDAERTARTTHEQVAKRLEAAVAAIPSIQQSVTRLEGQLQELQARIDTIDEDLTRTLDGILPELPDDPALQPLRSWRDHLAVPAPLLHGLARLQQITQHKERRRREAETVVAELSEALPTARDRARQALDALGEAPVPTLPAPTGTPPERTLHWTQKSGEADQLLKNARETSEARQRALQTAKEQESGARAAHLARVDALEGARSRLTTTMAELAADASACTAVCALPATWVETERPALQALNRAHEEAVVRVDERKKSWQAHAATHPGVDAPAAREELAAATAARAAADERCIELQVTLGKDDHAKSTSAQLLQQLAEHEAQAAPWKELNTCIGSSDGKVFRKYAQSLTLELLLEQANLHLTRLHPRYRLSRIPKTDLDFLVIDGDLADEPRTVNSLSGGEGFLVSLALALGLSSLSARDVRVESLFIDEGFGTLDEQSLEKALEVLDSLQSEGRQVGIISHVGGLAERIGVRVQVEPQGGGRSTVSIRTRTD